MTLGEHLEELRGCLLRSLGALVLACLLCIWPAKYLLEVIARPVIMVQRHFGQTTSLLATSPVETLVIFVKVVLISGLVLAGPYVIYELWTFVAKGLYPRERRWAYRLIPASVGLFLAGVAFMYVFVLMLSLKWLVGFSTWLPLPDARPNALERAMLGEAPPPTPTTQPALHAAPRVPLLSEDPPEPPIGTIWLNVSEGRLKLRTADRTVAVQLLRDDQRSMVTTHFKIGDYLSFVLLLTIAFGAAFQMPLVVYFLVRSGLVPAATFARYRKLVILCIVILAGILAPPDLLSHLMLSGPMIILFELGLWLARRKPTAGAAHA